MPWTPAFHTSQSEDPKVFHDNSDCPNGKRIPPEHRWEGVGTRRIRCHVCADLKHKGQ